MEACTAGTCQDVSHNADGKDTQPGYMIICSLKSIYRIGRVHSWDLEETAVSMQFHHIQQCCTPSEGEGRHCLAYMGLNSSPHSLELFTRGF